MQTYDPLQERIDELEDIIKTYENEIIELKEKLRFSEQDSENYYEILIDIYDRLKKEI